MRLLHHSLLFTLKNNVKWTDVRTKPLLNTCALSHLKSVVYIFFPSGSYDTRICEVWPEFGVNGKESMTLADVLRHEAGLASIDTSIPLEDLTMDRLKNNAVGAVFERQTPQ